jgi:hypothetical protein
MLEHRVRELQTAVVTLVKHLELERDVVAAERKRLDEIRLSGEADAPVHRLMGLIR